MHHYLRVHTLFFFSFRRGAFAWIQTYEIPSITGPLELSPRAVSTSSQPQVRHLRTKDKSSEQDKVGVNAWNKLKNRFTFALNFTLSCRETVSLPQSTDVLDVLISTATHYLQLLSSNNKNTTGGRDTIKFKNTFGQQSAENKWAQHCPLATSLPPSAIPGRLPAADNGCAPLRALYWNDGWGHLPHSRPYLLCPRANVCSPLKRTDGNSHKW